MFDVEYDEPINGRKLTECNIDSSRVTLLVGEELKRVLRLRKKLDKETMKRKASTKPVVKKVVPSSSCYAGTEVAPVTTSSRPMRASAAAAVANMLSEADFDENEFDEEAETTRDEASASKGKHYAKTTEHIGKEVSGEMLVDDVEVDILNLSKTLKKLRVCRDRA